MLSLSFRSEIRRCSVPTDEEPSLSASPKLLSITPFALGVNSASPSFSTVLLPAIKSSISSFISSALALLAASISAATPFDFKSPSKICSVPT